MVASGSRRARALAVLAGLLVAVAVPASRAAVITPPDGPSLAGGFTETFDSPTWYRRWDMSRAPARTSVVTGAEGSFLRVSIPVGSHDGTSFGLATGTVDAVRLQYRVRLSPNWDATKTYWNAKLPGFGAVQADPQGRCVAACGGTPANGLFAYSARVSLDPDNLPAFYVYDVERTASLAPFGATHRWSAPPLTPGVWHSVDLTIRMNDPGVPDGRLVAVLDGVRVFDRGDFLFRLAGLLHVGMAWFDVHYGGVGRAPAPLFVDLDDVAVDDVTASMPALAGITARR